MFKLNLITAALLFTFFSSIVSAQVIATVGNKKITKKLFDQKYSELKKNVFNPPTPRVFLEDLIKFEVGVQEAKKRNLQNDPIVKDKFNQELYKALLEKSLGKNIQNIKVTEGEMRRFYRLNPEIKTSHILIQFKPNSTNKEIAIAQKRANEIYKEVRKSKRSFAELVKLYSDDSISKRTGGDIGFQTGVSLAPTYYNAAKKLKVGSISKPIRTRFGFHIIKLTGLQKYKDANQRQVRAAVFDTKRKAEFEKFFKKLNRKYSIKRNNSAIKKLSK